MAYQLFDAQNQEITNADLQNRSIWYRHGVRREDVFVETYGQAFDVRINPEKRTNPTVPDLIHKNNLADLKCQNTPFFFAFKMKIDPTYAVTFNLKDAFNYGKWGHDHRNFVIFYWVDWVAVKMVSNEKAYTARPLTGVWKVDFAKLEQMRHKSPIHWYNQRNRQPETRPDLQKTLLDFEPRLKDGDRVWSIRETGINAACSYVFDLRNFERLA
jgi:hypothetical protein